MLTNSKGQALGQEVNIPPSHEEQRAEAVSRLKLLPMPGQQQEQVRNKVSQDARFWNVVEPSNAVALCGTKVCVSDLLCR